LFVICADIIPGTDFVENNINIFKTLSFCSFLFNFHIGTTLTFPPIEISFNVFSWFVRCFAGHLPEEHTYHVWDLFFSRMNSGSGGE